LCQLTKAGELVWHVQAGMQRSPPHDTRHAELSAAAGFLWDPKLQMLLYDWAIALHFTIDTCSLQKHLH